MTDTLRTRLVKIFHDVATNSCASEDDWNLLADAVIAELCLHREDMNEWAVLANGFRGHRYVTHWEENEPAPVTEIRSAEKLGLTGDGE